MSAVRRSRAIAPAEAKGLPSDQTPAVIGADGAYSAVRAALQRQPFMIMNPRSGGGKVGKFGLRDKAAALGAGVALLEGPGVVDVAALAWQAAMGPRLWWRASRPGGTSR